MHVGFDPATATRCPDGTTIVRNADGVSVVQRDDETDLVSFTCLDPDGWRIEIYWERA